MSKKVFYPDMKPLGFRDVMYDYLEGAGLAFDPMPMETRCTRPVKTTKKSWSVDYWSDFVIDKEAFHADLVAAECVLGKPILIEAKTYGHIPHHVYVVQSPSATKRVSVEPVGKVRTKERA